MDKNELQALYDHWENDEPKQEKGLLVGCDAKQEWMLPWWWEHYRSHNAYPVAFIDFGMSPAALAWCKQRGECIDFNESLDFLVPQEKISSNLKKTWQAVFLTKEFWEAREMWYKKPFSMLKSPFRQTIWTDIDCEIKGDLASLFEACNNEAGLAIAPEPDCSIERNIKNGILRPGEKCYNAGVIVFAHGSKGMLKWTRKIVESNADFAGDQGVLDYLILKEHLPIRELSTIYNWRMVQGSNHEAVIIHWVADWGKQHIRNEMIIGK